VFVVHLPDELSCSPPEMLVQTAGCETCKVEKYQHYRNTSKLNLFSGIATRGIQRTIMSIVTDGWIYKFYL
jgi:hypothetical protein